MSDRFVVEAERKVVGVAVRVPGGFRFFSSDPAYAEIEGQTFPRAKSMARLVAEIAQRLRSPGGGASTLSCSIH